MATRTIVTSHPDVACDVCERRLLRGEQPDIFLAAGRRRTVCELCAPRAAHEGWMRERDSHEVTLPPMRARRGRSFLERLRQAGRPADAEQEPAGGERGAEPEGDHYEFLDGYGRAKATPAAAVPQAAAAFLGEDPALAGESAEHAQAAAAQRPLTYAEQAIDVFNASEYPRRVAGVARSLGAPAVNVRSAEHLASVVTIVVAWELCWYRYEVDLSEPGAEAQAIAQGTELSELAREDRDANAHASESGTLSLLAA
jgi:hypothetical protein